MGEVLARGWRLYSHNWSVMMFTWFFGTLITTFIICCAVGFDVMVAPVLEFLPAPVLMIMTATTVVLGQAVTCVAMIRGVVFEEPGDEQRLHAWRSLPGLAPATALVGLIGQQMRSEHGAAALPLALAFMVSTWWLLQCVVDVAFGNSRFGLGAANKVLLGAAAETLPALAVGSVAIGGAMFAASSVSIFLVVLLWLPAMCMSTCLAIAAHQHVFGSLEERYAAEDARRPKAEYASRGSERLPSYLQAAEEPQVAAPASGFARPVAPAAGPATPQVHAVQLGAWNDAVSADTPWGTWMHVGGDGLVELQLTWSDGAGPFLLNVSTQAGQWQPVQPLVQSPATQQLRLVAGWYYLHLSHSVALPTPRGFQLAARGALTVPAAAAPAPPPGAAA
jgi:hypothetical protein